jgi:mono/diheme cytochrome c family protein
MNHIQLRALCALGSLILAGVAGAQEPPVPKPGPKRPPSMIDQAGSTDKQVVDDAAADRGKKIYIAQCITCHGASARGAQNGPDLVRSLTLLHDRYGNQIGPYLKKGHPTATSKFTDAEVIDLSHFLHARVEDTLRTSPLFHAQNILTGDPKAGEAYFNGAGKCATCHSPKGDLAGFGAKYDPVDIQQRFLFPRPAIGRGAGHARVTATVTTPSGAVVTGPLDRIDDFTISLRDASGQYYSWKRTSDLKVKIDDPFAPHARLLDELTDKNIHDTTAYLETLK